MTAKAALKELIPESKTLRQGRDGALATSALAILRRAPIYDPDLPLHIGGVARLHHSDKSIEYWEIMEQIVLAAIDRGVWSVFVHLGNEVKERFPDSWRVSLLIGRRDEALGKWDDAMKRYMSVTEKDPMRGPAYKRQVAVLKAQRKLPEAVSLLNYYLGLFSGDAEAWGELCSLCLATGRIEHALFAANELILLKYDDIAAHILVADIHMTLGGFQNFLSARRHYSFCLSMRGRTRSMRALYGLWMAAMHLRSENKWKETMYSETFAAVDIEDDNEDEDASGDGEGGGGKESTKRKKVLTVKDRREENDRAIAWAQDAIQAIYASVGESKGTEHSETDGNSSAKSEAHVVSVVAKALSTNS